ncbi:MAG: MiaB/RimO family radical SAM methylthiotransferase [Fibrobacterota bacterium]
MTRVHTHTLGCRTNQYDSEALLGGLALHGFTATPVLAEADVIIVNTCAVTDRALSKCGQAVRKLVRENPKACLLVAGCGARADADRFAKLPGVTQVFGVNALSEIVYFLTGKRPLSGSPFGPITAFGSRTRAHIKVQEGCDAFCTYCVVPILRGGPQSRSFNDCLDQARALIDQGFAELVFTGIHIGRYRDNKMGLGELVEAVAALPGEFRIRLSSIEPDELTDKLLDLVLDHPKVCCHLHLPLQSGDTEVLVRMKRRYTAEAFFKRIKEIRKRDPYCGLGTDIITGFPGETERSFALTCSRVAESPLTYGHVFPYSEREGTAASTLDGKVDIAHRRSGARN